MARHVFFSFHYKDVAEFRANVVRNSWLTKKNGNSDIFYDASIWESSKTKGENAIKSLINEGLNYTSVTAVLIGTNTWERRWVKYELVASFVDGNGILGININRIPDKYGNWYAKGQSPLDKLGILVSDDGTKLWFYELINGKWVSYADLPSVGNRQKNTLYFDNGNWFKKSEWGEFFKFSELFKTYDWLLDDGYNNLSNWVENAAQQAGR